MKELTSQSLQQAKAALDLYEQSGCVLLIEQCFIYGNRNIKARLR